jgi:hypothetical protein
MIISKILGNWLFGGFCCKKSAQAVCQQKGVDYATKI